LHPTPLNPKEMDIETQTSLPSGTAPVLGNILQVAKALKFNEDLAAVAAGIREKHPRKMLQAVDIEKNYLPGQPHIPLDDRLFAYLAESHTTNKLDEFLPFIRYIFVQTPPYDYIKPLYHQGSYKRKVKVSKNPGLYLV
jgi:hypothetical protein